MSAPPLTQLVVPPEEAHAIRANVRRADPLTLGPSYRMARLEHAAGLTELLADHRVSDPIYDLPRPITLCSISDWITGAQRKLPEATARISSTRVKASVVRHAALTGCLTPSASG